MASHKSSHKKSGHKKSGHKKGPAPKGSRGLSQGLVAREDLTADFPMGEKRFEPKQRKGTRFVGPDTGPATSA